MAAIGLVCLGLKSTEKSRAPFSSLRNHNVCRRWQRWLFSWSPSTCVVVIALFFSLSLLFVVASHKILYLCFVFRQSCHVAIFSSRNSYSIIYIFFLVARYGTRFAPTNTHLRRLSDARAVAVTKNTHMHLWASQTLISNDRYTPMRDA